ncbi:MAG: holin family protein [Desulfobacteraceae bacterium]|nr:holin family protein [Desulfobacteraceae bacterium]
MVQAKASIMTAEMNQEDKYTKRGRPTIIYAGLSFIGLVHVVFPILAWVALTFKGGPVALPSITLPDEFWMAWGGAVSIYILGRSSEKVGGEVGGLMGKMYGMISGTKK